MALGPCMFHSLHFGYRSVGRDLSTRWADIPTVGGLNSIQWTGGDDDTLLIEGVIFPEEFGGMAMLDVARQLAKSGEVLPLVTLAGNVHGMYVIEMVSEDQTYHNRHGMPRKDVYRLGLRKFRGGQFSVVSIVQSLFG